MAFSVGPLYPNLVASLTRRRISRSLCTKVFFLTLLFVVARVVPVRAQAVDSLAVEIDTVAVASPSISLKEAAWGVAVGDTVLATSWQLDATGVLAALPGSFVYDLGAVGWPHSWSPYGLDPQRIALLLNELPFNDPVTGRPRYDLLPFAFLNALHVQTSRLGQPLGVSATLRAYDVPRPLTEFRYWTSSNGLQSVMALHVQQRPRLLFNQMGVMQVLFGYGGHASDGEYPGSRLRRMRQLWGRLRYTQPRWSVELNNLHNRRQLGAHGGVEPQPGLSYESIYARVGAQVRDPQARRQTIRNDLSLTFRTALLATSPLALSTFWTAQTFRYRNPEQDTLEAKTNRWGLRARQTLGIGPHRIQLLAEGWFDQIRPSPQLALPDTLGTRAEWHLSLQDQIQQGNFSARFSGGIHRRQQTTFPDVSLNLSQQVDSLRVFFEGSHTGQSLSLIDLYGFGGKVQGNENLRHGKVSRGNLGLSWQSGFWDATLFGFASQTTHPVDLYATQAVDTVKVRQSGSPFRQGGLGADLGWRRTADRGLYLTLQPTWQRFFESETSGKYLRAGEALPAFFVQGRLGVRAALFEQDLLLDLSTRGRFWTSFQGRILHPATGLLVLPDTDIRPVEASGTLDVVAEGRIRTATLFLSYENVLSGTDLLVGNLLVPVYPLPAQRFRFGIYWPLEN